MRQTKIQKVFVCYGCGFPVKLLNVPMIKVRGIWTPNINYNHLTETVLKALYIKPARLTGNEIRFIRLHFEMTLQAFARRFGVSHVAVIKWQEMKNRPTTMNWATEKDLRLFIYTKLKITPRELIDLYQFLEEIKPRKQTPLQLDIEKIAV